MTEKSTAGVLTDPVMEVKLPGHPEQFTFKFFASGNIQIHSNSASSTGSVGLSADELHLLLELRSVAERVKP